MFACIPSLPSTSLNNATRVVHEVSSNPTRPKTRVKKSRANRAQGLPKTAKDSEKVYLSRQAATASPMQWCILLYNKYSTVSFMYMCRFAMYMCRFAMPILSWT